MRFRKNNNQNILRKTNSILCCSNIDDIQVLYIATNNTNEICDKNETLDYLFQNDYSIEYRDSLNKELLEISTQIKPKKSKLVLSPSNKYTYLRLVLTGNGFYYDVINKTFPVKINGGNITIDWNNL